MFQLPVVKVRLDGLTVPSELLVLLRVAVTLLLANTEGEVLSLTLNVALLPSSEVCPEILEMLKR